MRASAWLLGPLLLTAIACGGRPAPESPGDELTTYSVRGLVRTAPTPERALILVYHEAIPEFADANGNVVGMDSMTMPFDLAEGVKTQGIKAGDKIRFDLEVDWSLRVPGRVTAVEQLPPETELELGGG